MSGATNHNKIINQVAREILKPYGLFQKGQSRLWVDENTFYISMVSLSEMALKKIEEYRSFKDISYAKERIMNRNGYTVLSHELYQ